MLGMLDPEVFLCFATFYDVYVCIGVFFQTTESELFPFLFVFWKSCRIKIAFSNIIGMNNITFVCRFLSVIDPVLDSRTLNRFCHIKLQEEKYI